MATLTINEATAKEIYTEAAPGLKAVLENTFGGKKFFLTKVTERIKTVQDVFEALSEDYDDFMEDCANNGDTKDEIAYKILKRVVQVLNEGWKANWNNPNQYKWFPWFYMNSPGFRFVVSDRWHVGAVAGAGSRLCFASRELSDYAANTFIEIYKQLMTNEEN